MSSIEATPDAAQPAPIVVPPARHRDPSTGGLVVDPARTMEKAQVRFANKIAAAESEAAMWQAAYDEIEQQRQEEVTALSVRLADIEAEHSKALLRIIDLELALEAATAPGDPAAPDVADDVADPVAVPG